MDERLRSEAEPGLVSDVQDDDISLSVYVETVWRYRRIILASLGLVAILFAIAVLAYRIKTAVERIASFQVRLLFAGAAQNRYPNGTSFRQSDIVGVPVVAVDFGGPGLIRVGVCESAVTA